MLDPSEQVIWNKLVRFASLRPRSEQEVKLWAKRKKVSKKTLERLVAQLGEFELLDDEQFALWWIEQRRQFRPRSNRALIFELRNKGINSSLIKEVMAKAKVDEVQAAKDLLAKNESKWADLQGKEKKQKKWKFLGSKGFSWDTVQKVTG